MRRVSDDSLVKIANLNLDLSVCISYWAKVANVTVPTYPHWRPLWKAVDGTFLEPLIELDSVSTHIRMRRPRHFQLPPLIEYYFPARWPDLNRLSLHPAVLHEINNEGRRSHTSRRPFTLEARPREQPLPCRIEAWSRQTASVALRRCAPEPSP